MGADCGVGPTPKNARRRSCAQRPAGPLSLPRTCVPLTSVPGCRAASCAAFGNDRTPSRRVGVGLRSPPCPSAESTVGNRAAAAAAYPSAEGWNRSQPNIRPGSAVNRGPSRSPSETVQPPADTTATVCAAASWDRAQVGAGPDDHLGAARAQRPDPLDEVAHGQGRRRAVGDVVAADEDDRDVGVALQGRLDLELQAGRDGTHHREPVQPDGPPQAPGQAGGQQRARRLTAPVHPVAGGRRVAENDHGDRGPGKLRAVDAVAAWWRRLGHRDGASGLPGLTEEHTCRRRGGGHRGARADGRQPGHPQGALPARTIRYDGTSDPHTVTLARPSDALLSSLRRCGAWKSTVLGTWMDGVAAGRHAARGEEHDDG